MIVTCERCETEFQLDEARVPVSGARVRCSRCKHAFFVLPPAATRDEEIEHAASAALADDPTPQATEDLDAPPDAGPEPLVTEREGEESGSDWQFNTELPEDPGDSSPDLHASSAPAADIDDPFGEPDPTHHFGTGLDLDGELEEQRAPEAPEAAEDATEDLGSPIQWDFFDKPEERAAPAAAPATEHPSAPVLAISVDAPPGSEPLRHVPIVLRRAVDAVGWIAVVGLCAVALVRGLAPPPPVATSWPAPAPGLALEDVRGRWLDNASLGRLYVVSGRVMNRASDPAALPPLAIELRDASGAALGAPIPLRGPSSPGQLREADAAALATAGSDRPGGLASGVSWDFEVVAWPLPAQAARFAIRSRP